jgi:hypothetical protein
VLPFSWQCEDWERRGGEVMGEFSVERWRADLFICIVMSFARNRRHCLDRTSPHWIEMRKNEELKGVEGALRCVMI